MPNQQDNSLPANSKMYLSPVQDHQQAAMQIFQTSNDISTPEKLAVFLSNRAIARYKDVPQETRIAWLGTQIYALCLILHYQTPNPLDVEIDSRFADQMIMEDQDGVSSLRQVEMQEAFRRGIAREFGDFFGITPAGLLQFLKGYQRCEKRQKAIAILYAKEKKETLAKEKILEYELRARNLQLPFWKSSRKNTVTPEESEAHRQMIARQREEILKAQNDGNQ